MSDPLLSTSVDELPKNWDATHETSAGMQPRRFSTSSGLRGQIFCVALHVILVLAHVALIVVLVHHYEHDVTVNTGHESNTMSILVTVISQVIGTIYSAILVLVTQQLALKRDFHVRQSLSALHDKQTAWLGLGSSLLSLYRQAKLKTSLWRIILIAVYLTGIFVFHVTTPSLFDVVPFNITAPSIQPTKLARSIPLWNQNLGINDADAIFPPSVYEILNTLAIYPGMVTPGLLNSTIYDTIPTVAGASGTVTVNATMFQADCGLIRNLPLTSDNFHPATGSDTITGDPAGFSVTVASPNGDGDTLPVAVLIPIANPSLSVITIESIKVRSAVSPAIVVAARVPVVDSTGTVDGLTTIDPHVTGGQRNSTIVTSQLQILGCNLAALNVTVSVSAETGVLDKEPLPYPDATWHDWSLPPTTDDPMLMLAGTLPGDAPSVNSDYCAWLSVSTDGNRTCYTSNTFEAYLQSFLVPPLDRSTGEASALGGHTGFAFTDPTPNATVPLSDINQYLSQAVAAMLWYAASLDGDRLPLNQPVSQSLQGEATIPVQTLRSRLNLNKVPLYVGFATSCLLLVVSFILIRSKARITANLDSAGILQVTWLLSQDPAIADRVADLDEPSLEELRKAGLFEINFGDAVREGLQRRKSGLST